MKNLITIALLLLSLAGTAQTTKGWYIVEAAKTTNATRDQRMIIGLGSEIGYLGGRIGASIVHNYTLNLYKDSKVNYHNPSGRESSLGVKAYFKILNIDALHGYITMEGDYVIDPLDRKIASDFQWVPGAAVSLDIYKRLGARFAYNKTIYKQGGPKKPAIWKERDGGSIGLTFKLGKHD